MSIVVVNSGNQAHSGKGTHRIFYCFHLMSWGNVTCSRPPGKASWVRLRIYLLSNNGQSHKKMKHKSFGSSGLISVATNLLSGLTFYTFLTCSIGIENDTGFP